ncbi:MAG: glycosyltransferase family 39 protein, partial [Kiritimatiellae bacterium]|nr:glycosyltransferase family 39 protein [Kiritimatiellia bacterium]
MRWWIESIGTWGVLSVILLIGAALRFQSVDWDAGQHQHPDERFLTMVASAIEMPTSVAAYFNTEKSPANPYVRGFDSYAYGTAPLFLARLVAEQTGDTDYQQIYLVGRGISAVLDLLTVWLVFLIGRTFLPRGFALLASGFYALTVMAIQQAHFFTVDSAGTLMVTLCLYGCARMIAGGRLHNAVLAGLALGLGIACRVNLLLFAPLVAAAFFVHLKREGEHAERGIARAGIGLML